MKRKGTVKLKMAFGSEKNTQVAAQEHRHILRLLLLHHIQTSKVCDESLLAITLVLICQWQEFCMPHEKLFIINQMVKFQKSGCLLFRKSVDTLKNARISEGWYGSTGKVCYHMLFFNFRCLFINGRENSHYQLKQSFVNMRLKAT